MKKLKECFRPDCTTVSEPEKKARTRGRMTTKEKKEQQLQNSTRRDPSEFEHVQAALQTPIKAKEVPRRRTVGGKTNISQTVWTCRFSDQLPAPIRPFIISIKDVQADGNCGFRAISASIYEELGEDGWKTVRQDLIKELNSHMDLYDKVGGSDGRALDLLQMLSFSQSPAPVGHWMTMPDMGHLIASAYECVLVHLSSQQCLTFLPLHSKPIPALKRRIIAIAFIYYGHFVQVCILLP